MKDTVAIRESETASVAKLGTIFVQSGFFKDLRDQAQAVVKILYGRELGFSPVASVMGIHIIEGKPSLSSNLMGALVKRSGHYDYRVKEWTDKACELSFLQLVGEKWEVVGPSRFTIEDAQRAGVVRAGGSWTKYPKAMLLARALSAGVKAYCPDVSACPLYTPEELGAQVNEDGEVTELPKSARPAEVTTEPVTFTKSAASNQASGDNPTLVKDTSPQAAEPVMGCIEAGQAANFYRLFRDALKPALRKKSDELAHKWLESQGIVDDVGVPSARYIYKTSFYEVREAAVTHAAGLE